MKEANKRIFKAKPALAYINILKGFFTLVFKN